MKKNLLFIMNNLNCGGAEKALISLLETLDYSKYNVDLLLFKREGFFLPQVPKQVNLLEEPNEYKYFDMQIKLALHDCIKKNRFDIAIARIKAGLIFKTEKNAARCEQRVWKYLSKSLDNLAKEYDVAIGYMEKNPIYYCIEKVKARKKIGFIHTDYENLKMDPSIDLNYFEKIDYLVTISEESAKILKKNFPNLNKKIQIIYNIISTNIIKKLSLDTVKIEKKDINIVSVGRLHYTKGFEMAIESCRRLIGNGYEINWFVIGEGPERVNLEKLINSYGLQDNFILLGLKENPYSYIKAADIYVQPSRFEGKSIAIDEAKILHKPIVATNFTTVSDQIINQKNGLLVDMNSKALSEGIVTLIEDEKLRNKLVLNLSKEKLGTESEIEKLYEMINTV